MIEKSLKDISWQVPESEYRDDPALSYSTLAKYEREGFEHLDSLFDKVESPSLLFGSCVDTLITDGEYAFNEQFYVSDIPSMKPSVEPVVKKLYELYQNFYTDINSIPDSDILSIANEYNFQNAWKDATRCRVIREEGAKYYQTMFMAKDKRVVSQNVYNKVFACVLALKDSTQTSKYFADNDPFSNVERCYQLKFKARIDGIDYRCMADLLVIDHANKRVIPCDLKTSSHREYDFPKSFVQWMYSIQARLYWRIIRQNMDLDPYFKDFSLENYRFIVVNNIDNPIPLVWEFENTKTRGTIEIAGNKMRDPEEIGKELHSYLEDRPSIPFSIKLSAPNSIENWLNSSV